MNNLTLATFFFLLNYDYQLRKVSDHVRVCYGYQISQFLQFFDFIVELFQLCGIFCFSFYDPIFIQRDSKNEYFVICALNALLFSVPC